MLVEIIRSLFLRYIEEELNKKDRKRLGEFIVGNLGGRYFKEIVKYGDWNDTESPYYDEDNSRAICNLLIAAMKADKGE